MIRSIPYLNSCPKKCGFINAPQHIYGVHKIHLTTGKGWKANAFYKKLGFEKIGELPNHHFHQDFIVYEKFI